MFALEPPEYLPGLVYCALMASVDHFFVGECFQYSRQSYQNRARLRTPDGIQWITVPLIGGQFGQSIRDMNIDYSHTWRKKHLKALKFNYASAPFYEHYYPEIEAVLSQQLTTLGELSMACLELIHSQLDLTCSLEVTEANAREVDDAVATEIATEFATEFATEIATETSAAVSTPRKSRLVLSGDEARIDSDGGTVHILSYEHPTYRQNFAGFEPSMSVLDLLFMHGPDAQPILRSGIVNIGAAE